MKKIYTFKDGTEKTLTYKKGDLESLFKTTDTTIQEKYFPDTSENPDGTVVYDNPLVSVQEIEE